MRLTRLMWHLSWPACMRLQDKWSMHAPNKHGQVEERLFLLNLECLFLGASLPPQLVQRLFLASRRQTLPASSRMLRRPSLSAGTWLWQGGAVAGWSSGCSGCLSPRVLAVAGRQLQAGRPREESLEHTPREEREEAREARREESLDRGEGRGDRGQPRAESREPRAATEYSAS